MLAASCGNALPASHGQQDAGGRRVARPLKPERVALNVLALCFTLALIGRGLGESFTVFLKPISENFGWDRAQVVSVYSLTWLAGGLMAPVVGRLFDRYGPRIVYSLGLLLLGGAFLLASRAQALWQFQLSTGLCVGIGIASSATCRIRSCSAAGSARACRRRWRSSIPRPAQACWCCCRPRSF
jgi:MFS family permease